MESQNLYLTPTKIADASFLLKLVNTPKWHKYIGDRNIKTLKNAKEYAAKAVDAFDGEKGIGQYIIRLKKNNKPIGITGVYKRPTLEHVDIGFALIPQYEGYGYAFEATYTLLQNIRKLKSINRIEAITSKENIASQKLLEKLGLHFDKMIRLSPDDIPLMLFAINY